MTTELYDDPNRYARPAGLELLDKVAVFHGYQEFQLSRDAIRPLPVDKPLATKQRLLTSLMSGSRVQGRTVLDLGANSGFFAFWSLLGGARAATAVDMDPAYIGMMSDAAEMLGFTSFETAKANVAEWEQPADIVVALALIHWIYSCTAALGTLDAAVGLLSSFTREMLIVEWVDPSDSAIAFFGHLGFNPELAKGPYDLASFEAALDNHFSRWRRVGQVTPTRTIYVAFRNEHDIDTTCPMPLLHDASTVISCRRLTTLDGVDHWSRVYVLEDRVEKQTTGGLASHEAAVLATLDDPSFPRVLGSRDEGGTEVVAIERVAGTPLRKSREQVIADPASFKSFVADWLGVLDALRSAGVQHRDIREDNVIIRDGKPVLIDFGWAMTPTRRIAAPRSLGDTGRPSDGVFDDVYSSGVMFSRMHPPERFEPAISLMTSRDPSLCVSDLSVLARLFQA
jgi:hypothetical protein